VAPLPRFFQRVDLVQVLCPPSSSHGRVISSSRYFPSFSRFYFLRQAGVERFTPRGYVSVPLARVPRSPGSLVCPLSKDKWCCDKTSYSVFVVMQCSPSEIYRWGRQAVFLCSFPTTCDLAINRFLFPRFSEKWVMFLTSSLLSFFPVQEDSVFLRVESPIGYRLFPISNRLSDLKDVDRFPYFGRPLFSFLWLFLRQSPCLRDDLSPSKYSLSDPSVSSFFTTTYPFPSFFVSEMNVSPQLHSL